MKVLIVEDEAMARTRLGKNLEENFPDIQVVGMTGSVQGTLEWLRNNPAPDVIFMDVELTDGDCFEIFRQTEIHSRVVMTTAYDSYALKAFEAGSVDYLLKPISQEHLARAVNRCRERGVDSSASILNTVSEGGAPSWRKRWIVKVGDKIIPLEVNGIAWFYSEDKSNYMVLFDGRRFVLDCALDAVEQQLDPDAFFRISRGCIISRQAIVSVTKWHSGRLKITSKPASGETELLVSRARVDDFMAWLE